MKSTLLPVLAFHEPSTSILCPFSELLVKKKTLHQIMLPLMTPAEFSLSKVACVCAAGSALFGEYHRRDDQKDLQKNLRCGKM